MDVLFRKPKCRHTRHRNELWSARIRRDRGLLLHSIRRGVCVCAAPLTCTLIIVVAVARSGHSARRNWQYSTGAMSHQRFKKIIKPGTNRRLSGLTRRTLLRRRARLFGCAALAELLDAVPRRRQLHRRAEGRGQRGLVPRPRLSERLNRAAESKLTLVSARRPALGRQRLLADWLRVIWATWHLPLFFVLHQCVDCRPRADGSGHTCRSGGEPVARVRAERLHRSARPPSVRRPALVTPCGDSHFDSVGPTHPGRRGNDVMTGTSGIQ